ncbi:MAG: hypothetical protein M1482_13270, partial [Chloroflexi bacterium]|nr:hypothetical protein [Chloroflexota bacterium]
MAIFREYRRHRGPADEDVATLHFVVTLDEDFEQMAWGWNTERRALALQRRVIKEPQAVYDDVAGAPRSLPIPNQVQQV